VFGSSASSRRKLVHAGRRVGPSEFGHGKRWWPHSRAGHRACSPEVVWPVQFVKRRTFALRLCQRWKRRTLSHKVAPPRS
jgi:hypothetical protein